MPTLTVKGPLGTLKQALPRDVVVKVDGSQGHVRRRQRQQARPTRCPARMRAIVANMVHGVKEGFEKKLTLVGVGYRRRPRATS